jgi:DNA-binding CsgD family transcriptional regulator
MSVVALCERIDDARDLRLALLEEVHRLVAFDSFAWLLTDPTSEVGTAPIADVPCLPELPRLIRLKYATETNRWTHQTKPVARLHAATAGKLEQSLVWRELLSDHGVSDVVSIVFRDRFGCWAFLDLWRYAGVFTDAQAQVLSEHVDTITAALRRCTLRTFSQSPDARNRHPWPGPIVLVLSDRLEVQGQTPETEPYLRALVPPAGDRPAIPAGAYNVAAQLLAIEAGIDDHQPSARVHLDAGDWLALRAARIGDDIAVSIERASPAERLDLFRRSAGLTAREAELLHLLAAGSDTRSIASRMFLSEHTVQDHLKAIFAKTGTTSRRDLLARAIGP